MDNIMIGIIILNYSNYRVTIRCVNSILKDPPNQDFIILIVDNCSSNESVNELNAVFGNYDNIEIVSTSTNLGFAGGNQFGLEHLKSSDIQKCILTNSDIVFNRNAIEGMISDLESLDGSVIVGPKIYRLDGTIQPSLRTNLERVVDSIGLSHISRTKSIDEANATGIREGFSVSGCCFAINTTYFERMGAFDTNTFLYNEENILAMQAKNAGYHVFIDYNIYVIHEHAASTKAGTNIVFRKSEKLKSLLYYWNSYRDASIVLLQFINIAFFFTTLIQSRSLKKAVRVYSAGAEALTKLNS